MEHHLAVNKKLAFLQAGHDAQLISAISEEAAHKALNLCAF